MTARNSKIIWALVSAVLITGPVYAQVTEVVTGFETNREGVTLVSQPASFGDLQVVMFQDPREADVTAANIVADIATTTGLPSTEESFVANFVGDGFFGANGSAQSLDIRFQWANTNGTRWVLVETLQSPMLGDPAVHLDGTVSFKLNFPLFESEFPALTYTDRIGVALLVRETGANIPVGFRDPTSGGRLEFVGVSTVGLADTANPVPVPTLFIDGPTTSGDAGWIDVSFNLNTAPVAGWTFNGGDGVLDASDLGVNRGALAGIVITVEQTDTISNYVEVLLDDITIAAPVNDPTYPPTIAAPVTQGQTSVRVKDVLSSATNVSLEIDRSDGDNEDPFVADQTFNTNPAGALFVDFNALGGALQAGDRVRARQTNPSGVSAYSIVVMVNPPAVFSVTLALDEDGNGGVAPADFEFVGAAALNGGAPQGKPVYYVGATWQQVEFSLIPGVEPVIDFAGGNGLLQPDGGNYNIDSLFFSIDPTEPNAGLHEVFIDHVYYVDNLDNEVVISNAELGNPFALVRGQSTPLTTTSSTVSTAASFDGYRSNRLAWTWPDLVTSNTVSFYRPSGNFPDTAKAVGFWVYVVPPVESTIPRPAVLGPVVGAAPAVAVDLTTTGVTQVELFADGVSVGTLSSPADPAVFDTSTVGLALGVELTATQTTAADTSDPSNPKVASEPVAPRIQLQPVAYTDTKVMVFDVYNQIGSTASLVTLLTTNGVVGTADPAGANSVEVTLSSSLAIGDILTATQTVNGLTSPPSVAKTVTDVAPCVVTYREEFEVDPTAAWTVNGGPSDEVADFFFDYSSVGIPQAPNSRGAGTRGMKLQANLTSATFGGMSVSPTGLSFTGDYTLAFDWWGNFNGPFPGGGNGSTNLTTFGVLTNGTVAQWPGNANSIYFGATADGGSSADYRAYSPAAAASYPDGAPQYAATTRNNTNTYYASFGNVTAPAAQLALYPNQTGTTAIGSAGMSWNEVTITKTGAIVTWRLNGLLIASVDTTGLTLGGNNIMFGYSDINATSSTDPNAPAMLFGLIDNVRVLIAQPESAGPNDWDGDGDVDLADYEELAGCLFGPSVPPDRTDGCINTCLSTFDEDGDGDIDLTDFASFARGFNP